MEPRSDRKKVATGTYFSEETSGKFQEVEKREQFKILQKNFFWALKNLGEKSCDFRSCRGESDI